MVSCSCSMFADASEPSHNVHTAALYCSIGVYTAGLFRYPRHAQPRSYFCICVQQSTVTAAAAATRFVTGQAPSKTSRVTAWHTNGDSWQQHCQAPTQAAAEVKHLACCYSAATAGA
jgi:hypothetical protein